MALAGLLKILKPVGAGLALAYLATALVDGPPPVNFRPENPYAAKQAEIMEPQASLVVEKNIMKLGSLLSVPEGDLVLPGSVPEDRGGFDSLSPMQPLSGDSGHEVKGEVGSPAP